MTDNEVWLRDVAFSIEHGMPLQPSPKRLRLVADEIEQQSFLIERLISAIAGFNIVAAEQWRAERDKLLPTNGSDNICEWHEPDDETDEWQTACGRSWCFTYDGPIENGMKFCHNCGRPVSIVPLPTKDSEPNSEASED